MQTHDTRLSLFPTTAGSWLAAIGIGAGLWLGLIAVLLLAGMTL